MINNKDTKVSYKGNGQTTVFPFSFPFIKAEYIHVAIYDSLTKETKILTSDYYVDSTAKTVTYPGYPPGQAPAEQNTPPILPETSYITIFRQTDIDQLIDLGSKYPLPEIESMVDKLTEIQQEHSESLSRCVMVDIASGMVPAEYLQQIISKAAEAKKAADSAEESKTVAAESAAAATEAATAAGQSATDAAMSLQEAKDLIGVIGVAGEAYDPTKTYKIPDIVITPDGTAWRCLQTSTGEYPATSSKWVAVALAQGETFEYDDDGNLMPLEYAQTSSMWQVVDGDIMPAEVVRL